MKCELYQFTPEVYPFNLWIYVGKDVSGMVECFKNQNLSATSLDGWQESVKK